MNRISAITSLGALLATASAAQAVTVTTFDDWFPDSVYASWTNAELSMNATNFGVKATGFGGGYANVGDPFLIDGTGAMTLQLSATVTSGVAGFIVALGDTTGHEWNYAWYGNVPGGGVNGSNDYVFTKALSAFNYSTGAAGQLDFSKIDYIHVQVDPGFNPNLLYDVSFNDLSLITGAANLTWNNAGGTGDGATWDVATNQNWNNGTATAVFNQGDNVTFNDVNNAHTSVTINSVVNPGSTTVNTSSAYIFSGTGGIGGAGGLTVSGTGSLTLNTANTYAGATTVNSGATLTVNGSIPATAVIANGNVVFGANTGSGILARNVASIALDGSGKVSVASPSSAASRTVLVTGALTFGGSTPALAGVLDLGANDMIVRGGNVAAIRTQLRVGLAGTAGITSSAAAASSADKTAIGYALISAAGTFDGQAVAIGDVVLKYTLLGDSNLDGNTNFDDLLALSQNYGGTSTSWTTGDFNYDGATNFDDLLGLSQNYSKSLSASEVSLLGASFASDYALALTLVPEPGTLCFVAMSAVSVLRRRRC